MYYLFQPFMKEKEGGEKAGRRGLCYYDDNVRDVILSNQ